MKKFLFIISLVLFISCNTKHEQENQSKNEQPQTIIVTTDNIQYDIYWDKDGDVDVRIITLTKDNETHDYVIGTSYVGRGGGVSIEHWAGCKCLKNQ